MTQKTVNIDQPVALNGGFADNGFKDVRTAIATEKLPFGQLISRQSGSDSKGKRPAAATDITNVKNVFGVSVSDQARESDKDSLPAGYNNEDAASALGEGRIYVKVEDAVTPASDVYVRYAAKPTIQTIVFSAALVTSNLIDGEINGEAITQIPFDTDNDTTLDNIATEIQLNVKVLTAARSGTRTIIVTSIQDEPVVLTNYIVTAGASQATSVIATTQVERKEVERGSFRTDGDSTTAALLPGAKFTRSAASGELAVVSVDN